VSNVNFDNKNGEGGSLNILWKIPDGNVFAHLGFKSKVLPRTLTDLSAWWVSAPQAHSRVSNVNFDIGGWTML